MEAGWQRLSSMAYYRAVDSNDRRTILFAVNDGAAVTDMVQDQVFGPFTLSSLRAFKCRISPRLVTYPFLFEPFLTRKFRHFCGQVHMQLLLLPAGGVPGSFCGHGKMHLSLSILPQTYHEFTHIECEKVLQRNGERETADRPGPASLISWLFMSAVGSVLLLSTTNQLCQNVASVPFLWVLPLSLYLATFIIAFEGSDLYRRMWCLPCWHPVLF